MHSYLFWKCNSSGSRGASEPFVLEGKKEWKALTPIFWLLPSSLYKACSIGLKNPSNQFPTHIEHFPIFLIFSPTKTTPASPHHLSQCISPTLYLLLLSWPWSLLYQYPKQIEFSIVMSIQLKTVLGMRQRTQSLSTTRMRW